MELEWKEMKNFTREPVIWQHSKIEEEEDEGENWVPLKTGIWIVGESMKDY